MEIRPTDKYPHPLPLSAIRSAIPAPSVTPAKTAEVASKADAATDTVLSKPGKEQLAQALKSINSSLQERSPGLEFTVDLDSDRAVVKVVDMDTHEVIRQMPSREAIEIAKALDKLHALLIKQSA